MLVIHGYIKLIRRQGVYLKLIQDGAPGHAARETKQDLEERGIIVIY
jgi:ketohexokinase/beta-glucosidase